MDQINPLHIPHIAELVISLFTDTKDLLSCRLASSSWYTFATKELRRKCVHKFRNGYEVGNFLDNVLPLFGRAMEDDEEDDDEKGRIILPVIKFKFSPAFFLSPSDPHRIFDFLYAMSYHHIRSLELNFRLSFLEYHRHHNVTLPLLELGNDEEEIRLINLPTLTNLTLVYKDEMEVVRDAGINAISALFRLVFNNSPNLEHLDIQLSGANSGEGEVDIVVALYRDIISSRAIGPQLKYFQLFMDAGEEDIRELGRRLKERKVLLKFLSLYSQRMPHLEVPLLNILQPHKDSLKQLAVDTDFRDIIMVLPKFPKVETLSVQIRSRYESFEFLKRFPNLKLLSILPALNDELWVGNYDNYEINYWEPPLASCREHVRWLSTPYLGHINMSRLVTLFPNLKTLSFVSTPDHHAFAIRRVFSELISLEELMINVDYYNPFPATSITMDSILTGFDEDTCREILASYDYSDENRFFCGPRNVGVNNLGRLKKLHIMNTGIMNVDYGHRHETVAVTDVGVKVAILQMVPTLKECRIMDHYCLSPECLQLLKEINNDNNNAPVEVGMCRHCFVGNCKPFLCTKS